MIKEGMKNLPLMWYIESKRKMLKSEVVKDRVLSEDKELLRAMFAQVVT